MPRAVAARPDGHGKAQIERLALECRPYEPTHKIRYLFKNMSISNRSSTPSVERRAVAFPQRNRAPQNFCAIF
jgi:hypothetical protein